MTITLTSEISKENIQNFSELEQAAARIGREIGQELIRSALEQLDAEILVERDAQRYRCKGLQATCIKTSLGEVEYNRRVYLDNAAVEGKRCVYLLDEVLNINKVGLMSEELCQMVASTVVEMPYRAAAAVIQESTGMNISHQAVWNIAQTLGEQQSKQVERHAELAKQNKGVGSIETKILYEENDGIWLKLQGKSRKEFGSSKEMKVGIGYDGVRWEKTKSGVRRTLDSKVAYASFENAAEFRRNKEGLLSSRYNVDEIELRVLNGDGANWIQKKPGVNCICVLDAFHRNKKILECVKNREFANVLQNLLYNKQIDTLLTCLEAQINSTEDASELEGLKELQRYYTENKDALLGYYDRDIEIPQTRAPGVIRHARLGSMESNIFTLIGNRMKGRRACWSINGANHLALLLCLRHTVGFENLFAKLPPVPAREDAAWKSEPILSAAKIPEHTGHGYEPPHQLHISGTSGWLNGFLKNLTRIN